MKHLNGKTTKIIACTLVAAMLCGGVSVASYAQGTKDGQETAAAQQTDSSKTAATGTDSATGDLSKDETVYVLANADGSVKKVIVSDWIKNPNGDQTVTDATSLDDVQTVNGDETYTMDKDNMRVWDAEGSDVYYQGTTDKTLPVDVAVSYTLDGKKISPDELAGKSGKVTIRFDYTNNEKQTAEIDGKTQSIYVPFLMLTGTMLDNDNFSNVEVTNGKVVNDGDKTIVVGFALPGMQQDLDINKSDFEIPSYVEVTADVTDFQLDTTLTYASNDVFNELNTDKLDEIDSAGDDINALSTNMTALVNGSSELYGYLAQLLDKSGDLITGVNQLESGAEQLASGTSSIADGTEELQSYLSQLNSGLQEIVGYNSTLNGGAEQVFNELLTESNTQLTAAGLTVPTLTIDNYDAVLDGVLANLDDATVRASAETQARANTDTIRATITSQYHDTILEGVLAAAGVVNADGSAMTASQYAAAASAGLIPSATQAAISAAVSNQIELQVESYIQGIITDAANKAAAGRQSVTALKAQLDSYNEFYQGISDYTSSVSDAYAGSSQILSNMGVLVDGTSDAASGMASLLSGLQTLSGSSNTLVSAVSQITDGAMTLTNSMKQYNEEGIQKIVEMYGDVDTLAQRVQAIADASKNYDTFGGLADGMSGSVKFVYTTDSITTDN